LKKYGFPDEFIKVFNTLYKGLKAKVMVNGFLSEEFDILRSVKQGDALSCALFILCIDPLIRKINSNNHIEKVEPNILGDKAGGYADDIYAIIKDNNESLQQLFNEYETFGRCSGLLLNATKTEILPINSLTLNYNINIYGRNVILNTLNNVKICGKMFSNNVNTERQHNILDKIESMSKQFASWIPRNLTIEGKIIISKCFGLSQIIHILQSTHVPAEYLKTIEKLIFKFIWNKNFLHNNAPDKIKRDILKCSYKDGGLKAPDIFYLDSALKYKQVIRSFNLDHSIGEVQQSLTQHKHIMALSNNKFIDIGVNIHNLFSDSVMSFVGEIVVNDDNRIHQNYFDIVNSVVIADYCKFKKLNNLIINYANTICNRINIVTISDLVKEYFHPTVHNYRLQILAIKNIFKHNLIINLHNHRTINHTPLVTHINLNINKFKQINKITTKDIRIKLSVLNNKTTFNFTKICNDYNLNPDYLNNYNPFIMLRSKHNSTAINVWHFRILHKVIYSKKKLFLFKTVDSPNCDICGEIESTKHLIFECNRAIELWRNFTIAVNQSFNFHLNHISNEQIIFGFKGELAVLNNTLGRIKQILSFPIRPIMQISQIIDLIHFQFNYEKSHAVTIKSKIIHNKMWSKYNNN
jgi:hypothetical protein